MIQPLRRLHLRVFVLLAVLLAVLFASGLLLRKPPAPENPSVDWTALPEARR